MRKSREIVNAVWSDLYTGDAITWVMSSWGACADAMSGTATRAVAPTRVIAPAKAIAGMRYAARHCVNICPRLPSAAGLQDDCLDPIVRSSNPHALGLLARWSGTSVPLRRHYGDEALEDPGAAPGREPTSSKVAWPAGAAGERRPRLQNSGLRDRSDTTLTHARRRAGR
jgi:hypothetical protein